MQDELFVFLGTHQPLELVSMKAAQKNDYLPVHLQSALDDQGRQRLHGAFTGGRSAGYYNTVGSKEGFRPSEYSSSRNSRANIAAAKPEDFMDDEDIREVKAFSIGATEEYDQFGTSKAEIESRRILNDNINQEKTILSEVAKHLAGDVFSSTMDSIGSRLLKQMGWKEGQGVGPRVKRSRIASDDVSSSLTFAPKNSSIVILKAKKDKYGIGYDLGTPGTLHGSNRPARTTGFGVGIFEEEDDDIYEQITTDYEATLESDRSQSKNLMPNPYLNTKSKTLGEVCKDGRMPLHGFVVIRQNVSDQPLYPDPITPPDFSGHHVFDEDSSTLTKYSSLNPDTRREILGEEALKGPDRSVFSYIAAKDKKKLDSYISKATKISVTIPRISKELAKSALKGFMPFGNDQAKQLNYKLYLSVMAGESDNTLETISESDLQEFSKAAEMFRPMSSFMASRFVSATTSDTAAAPMPLFPDSSLDSTIKSEEAAKKGKFGRLTRTSVEWIPNHLLCKRFDVKNPYPNVSLLSDEEKKAALMDKQALNEKTMEYLKQERQRMLNTNEITEIHNNEIEENEVEVDHKLQEKPSMDIFKAIFADSDSESEVTHKEVTNKEVKQKEVYHIKDGATESDGINPVLFKPVFRKKELRKSANIQKKTAKSSARPSSSSVKLVFEFEEDSGHIPEIKNGSTRELKGENKKLESEDEWEEAPQCSISRPKASDLI